MTLYICISIESAISIASTTKLITIEYILLLFFGRKKIFISILHIIFFHETSEKKTQEFETKSILFFMLHACRMSHVTIKPNQIKPNQTEPNDFQFCRHFNKSNRTNGRERVREKNKSKFSIENKIDICRLKNPVECILPSYTHTHTHTLAHVLWIQIFNYGKLFTGNETK